MKLTTLNVEGLPEILELPEDFKKFLLQPETQKQLSTYDIEGIYDKLNSSSFKVNCISLFTQLLYSIGINPLDYLEYIPYFFLYSTSLVAIKIPNNIKNINSYAFYDCRDFTSITIPSSVIEIGESAFSGYNKLQDIYITDIAAWCNISGLYNLMDYGSSSKNLYLNNELVTSILIPDGVTAIPPSAFRNCSSLINITIPNGVTSIGDYTISGCSGLMSATIPSSVGAIGNYAFYNCSKLRNIKYTGTKNQWLKIKHGYRWNDVSPIKTIHCTDGDIKL